MVTALTRRKMKELHFHKSPRFSVKSEEVVPMSTHCREVKVNEFEGKTKTKTLALGHQNITRDLREWLELGR